MRHKKAEQLLFGFFMSHQFAPIINFQESLILADQQVFLPEQSPYNGMRLSLQKQKHY